MNGCIHTLPSKPSLKEIARYMRMGSSAPDGILAERVHALLELTVSTIRPECIWRRFPISDGLIGSKHLQFAVSDSLAAHLEGCRDVYLVCGTIGTGFDALQRRVSATSASDSLILQAIGAAMIEDLMDHAETEIRKELAECESLTPRYSPGYGNFPLDAQRAMLDLLDAPRRIGVSLTDTLLMAPSKSVSAVIGVTPHQVQGLF
jgi:hypothetical protein